MVIRLKMPPQGSRTLGAAWPPTFTLVLLALSWCAGRVLQSRDLPGGSLVVLGCNSSPPPPPPDCMTSRWLFQLRASMSDAVQREERGGGNGFMVLASPGVCCQHTVGPQS